MFSNTAGFIGLGLIGGSLVKNIRKQNPDCKIIAFDSDTPSLLQAQLNGDINIIAHAVDETFSDCDIIFMCAPVSVNVKYLELLKDIVKEDAIITDVGSTKTGIMECAAKLGMQKYFIGGHPMAGTEKSGYVNSKITMFENAFYIITPFPESNAKKQLRLIEFVHSLNALPMVMDADEHDLSVGTISHLPHLAAFALVDLLRTTDDNENTMKRIAAGGFKDITRIANSSPQMWEAICMENKKSINILLDRYIERLEILRSMINNGESAALMQDFKDSGDFRNSMDDRSAGAITREYAFTIDVPDVAGSIAGVLNVFVLHGITIKNLGVLHSREYNEATLKITFYDESSMNKAADVLQKNDITVYKK